MNSHGTCLWCTFIAHKNQVPTESSEWNNIKFCKRYKTRLVLWLFIFNDRSIYMNGKMYEFKFYEIQFKKRSAVKGCCKKYKTNMFSYRFRKEKDWVFFNLKWFLVCLLGSFLFKISNHYFNELCCGIWLYDCL